MNQVVDKVYVEDAEECLYSGAILCWYEKAYNTYEQKNHTNDECDDTIRRPFWSCSLYQIANSFHLPGVRNSYTYSYYIIRFSRSF